MKTVETIAGPFDRKRLNELKIVLVNNECFDDMTTVTFEGQPLLIRLGKYLVEYVEKQLDR